MTDWIRRPNDNRLRTAWANDCATTRGLLSAWWGLQMAVAVMFMLLSAHSTAAEKPLESLGRLTTWYLSLVRDPYHTLGPEELKLGANSIASVIRVGIKLPPDPDLDRSKLLIKPLSDVTMSDLPKSLRKRVEADFKRTMGGDPRFKGWKVELVSGPQMVGARLDTTRRRLQVPAGLIGRMFLKSVRDEGSFFEQMMWTLSHPTFADRRATRTNDTFDLTSEGDLFYRSRDDGIADVVIIAIERSIAKHIEEVVRNVQ